jgi:hypothetical protein
MVTPPGVLIAANHASLGGVKPFWTTIGSSGDDAGLALASLLHTSWVEPIFPLLKGVYTMTEFVVAIDHITYYVVRAEDEVTAIDLVLEGQGQEISSETRDAYMTDYQSGDFKAR